MKVIKQLFNNNPVCPECNKFILTSHKRSEKSITGEYTYKCIGCNVEFIIKMMWSKIIIKSENFQIRFDGQGLFSVYDKNNKKHPRINDQRFLQGLLDEVKKVDEYNDYLELKKLIRNSLK